MTDCRGAEGYETLVADVWPWVDAALYAFIPFFVILALNSLIIRHLVAARRFRDELSGSYSSTGGARRVTAGDSEGLPGATNTRLVVTLLAVSFAFLVATLPRSAALIVAAFIQHLVRSSGEEWTTAATVTACHVRLALAATELMMYTNHAINFFLYCAAGERFRRQLCLLCRCRSGNAESRHRNQIELTVNDKPTSGGADRAVAPSSTRGTRGTLRDVKKLGLRCVTEIK